MSKREVWVVEYQGHTSGDWFVLGSNAGHSWKVDAEIKAQESRMFHPSRVVRYVPAPKPKKVKK